MILVVRAGEFIPGLPAIPENRRFSILFEEDSMTDSSHPLQLPPSALTADIRPGNLPFADTGELTPFRGMLGQARAQAALAFGVAMQRPGYNIYVMGEPGTGRLSLATRYLEVRAGEEPAPPDWLYLNNFEEASQPLALRLPTGRGRALCADIEALVDNLLALFPAAFENPAFQRRKTAIDREFKQRYEQAVDRVEKRARDKNIVLFRDGDTLSFTPLVAGKPADEDTFVALPEKRKESFHHDTRELEGYLTELLAELPQWQRESGDRSKRLERETVEQAIEPVLAGLREKYADLPEVLGYLDALRRHFSTGLREPSAEERADEPGEAAARRGALIDRYVPRLLVGHAPERGAPVVYEPNPTHANLFGRVDYANVQGAMVTHYRLIRPGALHRANGGYLILEGEKLLMEPEVWPALKRALKTGAIKIESPAADPFPPVMTLDPEAIPLAVKVVLVGSHDLYDLLQDLDEEFGELFRVLAEFDDDLERTPETMLDFARLVKAHAEAAGSAPLTAAAVARLIACSARRAEHQRRLSAHLGEVFDLVSEADLIRQAEHAPLIDLQHVRKALAAKEERLGRTGRLLLEEMLDGTILIDTDGDAVGRINGLTVLEVGGRCFGSPARITATAHAGDLGVVDIEREVELGQAIHSKGVMILAGYIGHKYARTFPLAISAHIALEQSYGHVDGDSASLAELCALISALTDVPIAQSFAVTGSLNQYGDVQAVGGVNEKIEGYFRLCRARGLNGRQGVIIPRANVRNLMLDDEVVDAVRRRDFMIYAVGAVEAALELLTGQKAEKLDQLAVMRLRKMAKQGEKKE
jgi:lon-related putative ATP-dependent protease